MVFILENPLNFSKILNKVLHFQPWIPFPIHSLGPPLSLCLFLFLPSSTTSSSPCCPPLRPQCLFLPWVPTCPLIRSVLCGRILPFLGPSAFLKNHLDLLSQGTHPLMTCKMFTPTAHNVCLQYSFPTFPLHIPNALAFTSPCLVPFLLLSMPKIYDDSVMINSVW